MSSYVKQILHTQVFNVLNIFIGFATIFLLLRYLNVVQYGEYVLIQGFIAIGGLLFSQNLFVYTRIYIPGAEINVQYGYLKTVIIIIFLFYFSVIFFVKILGFEDVIWDFLGLENSIGYTVLIMLSFELLNMEFMRYFIAIRKIFLQNYMQFYQKVFVFFGSLVLIYNSNFNIKEFLYLYISGQLLVLIICINNIDIVGFLKSYFMQDVLQRGYAIALPMFPIGLMSFALNYTDTLIISKFIDKEHVAQYGFASQIISIAMMMIGSSIVLTLFPYATHAHNNNDIKLREDFFVRMYKFGIYLSIVFYLLSTVNAYFIIEALNLKAYSNVPMYISILAIFPLFQLIYSVTSHYLQLLHVFKIQVIIALFVIVENFVLNYYMIQSYGVMGSAFASLLAFITLAALYLVVVTKYNQGLFKIFKKSTNRSIPLMLVLAIGIGFSFHYFSFYRNVKIVFIFDLLSVMLASVFLFKFKNISGKVK